MKFFRHRKRRGRLVIVMIALGALLIALLLPEKPQVTFQGKGGRELRFLGVTKGTHHDAPSTSGWPKIASRLPRPLRQLLGIGHSPSVQVAQPALVAWFLRTGDLMPVGELFLDSGNGDPIQVGPAYSVHLLGTNRAIEAYLLPRWPKRSRLATLTTGSEGPFGRLSVPLKLPREKAAFPVWRADPLPKEHRIGEYSIRLTELDYRPLGEDSGFPVLQARLEIRREEAFTALLAPQAWKVLDPTGEQWTSATRLSFLRRDGAFWIPLSSPPQRMPLWLSEPVWKLEIILEAAPSAGLPWGEAARFGPVTTRDETIPLGRLQVTDSDPVSVSLHRVRGVGLETSFSHFLWFKRLGQPGRLRLSDLSIQVEARDGHGRRLEVGPAERLLETTLPGGREVQEELRIGLAASDAETIRFEVAALENPRLTFFVAPPRLLPAAARR